MKLINFLIVLSFSKQSLKINIILFSFPIIINAKIFFLFHSMSSAPKTYRFTRTCEDQFIPSLLYSLRRIKIYSTIPMIVHKKKKKKQQRSIFRKEVSVRI
jgi:hypothetical protein